MNLTTSPQRIDGSAAAPRWWQPVLMASMAGGMAWGIRGQYGHETGAMIAGLLVGLVLVFLFCPKGSSQSAMRAVAWCTVAIGFGGSMTYGQTVGLTHDAALIGHWDALRWGLLGLAIKGGIWIGFAGVFLGAGLGGVRYRPRELFALMSAAVGAYVLGVYLLNRPFEPAQKILPWLYFSDHWHWEPNADLKPRPECWGGLLFALAVVTAYTGWIRRDRLARNLAFWAIAAGAIGFPLGQSLQAFHAWNIDLFREGALSGIDAHINWWNMMETTFGAVLGAILGFGLWLNRDRISCPGGNGRAPVEPLIEWPLLFLYLALLISGEFLEVPQIEPFTDLGLAMGVLPMALIAWSPRWPYLIALPITLLPIAGKTLRQLAYSEGTIPIPLGWWIYVVVPLVLTSAAAMWLARGAKSGQSTGVIAQRALLLATWLYFGLNFAFFHFPWPWSTWTSRTPNGIIFSACALGITVWVLAIGARRRRLEGRIQELV